MADGPHSPDHPGSCGAGLAVQVAVLTVGALFRQQVARNGRAVALGGTTAGP